MQAKQALGEGANAVPAGRGIFRPSRTRAAYFISDTFTGARFCALTIAASSTCWVL